jgi:hypothetical protein
LLIKFILACARRTNQAKENDEKLATLKERKEHQQKEVEKKHKDADMRKRQAKKCRREEKEEPEDNAARARYT